MNHNKEIGIANIVPEFLEIEENITGSRKGTLMHLFFQKINFKENYTLEQLENLKQELIAKNIIEEKEAKYINLKKVLEFTKSNLYKILQECEKVEKEKAFCIKLNAKEVFEEANKESILVQGIIDLYGIKNDDIILVDYKTDFVQNEQELKNKYEKQLFLYKQALEEAFNKKVKEIYIYSTFLEKEIKLEM